MNFEEKLNILNEKVIKSGAHVPKDDEMCAMEAVAWLAGEPWSDKPACTCPVIAAFVRQWNDGIRDDETRTRLLRPLIPRLLNTRASNAIERRRMWLAVDWSIRECTTAFLRLVPSLERHADLLAALPEIMSKNSLREARPLVQASRKDAYAAYAAAAAAYAAAASAAYAAASAAYAAAYAAAASAASDASAAAAAAAASDAYAAASDAAYDAAAASASAASAAYAAAASAASKNRIAAVIAETQASAQQLVIRMCEVQEASHEQP